MAKRRRAFKQKDGVQSSQEGVIKTIYPHLQFKPSPIPYVAEHNYLPDFYMGVHTVTGKPCYLELKEWMQRSDVAKYRHVMKSNPHIHLYFLVYDAPTDVFVQLASIPGCFVRQGYSKIPADWLDEILPPNTTNDTSRPTEVQPDSRTVTNKSLSRFTVSDGEA